MSSARLHSVARDRSLIDRVGDLPRSHAIADSVRLIDPAARMPIELIIWQLAHQEHYRVGRCSPFAVVQQVRTVHEPAVDVGFADLGIGDHSKSLQPLTVVEDALALDLDTRVTMTRM